MKVSFFPFGQSAKDLAAFHYLIACPEIWEPQRTDDASIEQVKDAILTGAFLAIFRAETGDELGFSIYLPKGLGLYEQHIGVLEAGRGLAALHAVSQATDRMFLETDALSIIAPCPTFNPGAASFAQMSNAPHWFTMPGFYVRDGQTHDNQVHGKFFSQWVMEAHEGFMGEATMVKLDEPPTNPIHGFYNLACELANNRQFTKALLAFNLFATISGLPLASIPFRDNRTCLLDIAGRRMFFEVETASCQPEQA